MAKGIKTGGRKAGTPNKKNAELIAKVEAEGITPLDYLLRVMRDVGIDERRRDEAAKAAAPYCHAKLSSVDMAVTQQENPPEEMTEADLERIARTGSAGVAEAQESATIAPGVH